MVNVPFASIGPKVTPPFEAITVGVTHAVRLPIAASTNVAMNDGVRSWFPAAALTAFVSELSNNFLTDGAFIVSQFQDYAYRLEGVQPLPQTVDGEIEEDSHLFEA